MPVADFAGRRNWGYDGVDLFAPAHSYGTPDDLRRLVDAAHARGLAVILDVVYNHFGPDGNYLPAFSRDYFTTRHTDALGRRRSTSTASTADVVRAFLIENALHWVHEYHVDGLRLDATPRPHRRQPAALPRRARRDGPRARSTAATCILIAEDHAQPARR